MLDRKKSLIVIFLIIIFLNYIYYIIPKDLKIHFIDVGQGDATLIITPRHKTILVDGGGSKEKEEFDVGESTLLPYLLDRKITTIDYMMISHFDADHCNGLIAVLKNIRVKTLLISEQLEICNEYNNIVDIVKEKNIDICIVKKGDKIEIDSNVFMNIIYPQKELELKDINNNSIVAKLEYNDFSMLFTGDIEKEAEQKIIQYYSSNAKDLKSIILKIAHHGSKTSTKEELLELINPKIALIGVGKNNMFGHPSTETIKLLEKHNIKVYRTDIDGEIRIDVNKSGKIKIKKMIN